MSEIMKITNEMKERKEKRISEMIDRVNKDIQSALNAEQNSVCFAFDKTDAYYYEVREKLENAGYRIVPTGYINGIWQRTEDITW